MFFNRTRKRRDDAKDAQESEERRVPSAKQRRSVKQLIPYEAMLSNGLVYLGADRWSVALQLSDVNYLISTEEHQMEILDRWARFLNLFDANMQVQVLVSNQTLKSVMVADQLAMTMHDDPYDPLRDDFNCVVRDKLSAMTSNVVTTKCVVITLTEADRERAQLTLNRLALTAESNLNGIDGCRVHRLNRTELLAMLARQYRPDQPFTFDEETFEQEPRTDSKDFIAPWCIDMPDASTLRLIDDERDVWHRSLWIRDYPPELSDQLISKLASLKSCLNISVHLTPHSRGDGLEAVKRKVAEIDMQIVEERRRNIKQKLPADMISADLQDSKNQAAGLRDELQHSTQHLIDSMIVIGVSAGDEEELDQRIKDVQAIVRQESCTAEALTYMQLEGFAAELPLGVCAPPMRRTLTTNSAAILIPFTTQEIYEPDGVWYGLNARSGNAISADRRMLMNQNGFILGQTGSGKSQAAKSEMFQRFLESDDDLVIIDPEREYTPLCEALGGTEVEISASSTQRINPMDILLDADVDGDPIRAKAVSVLSMIGALIGGSEGLSAESKGMLDRCILQIYREMLNDPSKPQPTLHDLHARLVSLNDPLGFQLALELEMYTEGSLSGFAGRTNVDLSNRFVNFNVAGLDGELRTFGMMVVLDNVWNRVVANRDKGRRTWLWIDEFHRFFSNPYASRQFLDIFKRGRKYGLGVTGITQNIEELLANQEARLMLSNSDFLLMMNQFPTDADQLAALLKLSDEQRAFFTGVNAGQGLAKIGNAFIPVDGRIDRASGMYRLFTTKFCENAFEAHA